MRPFLSSLSIAHSQGASSPPSRLELFGRLGFQLGLASLGAMGDALLCEKEPSRMPWIFCGQEKGESLESCSPLLDVDHLERKE
ncbi:hypothetical protein CK203_115829 [Vitis vinifera]|uniref:Uncharacterized protein n=1 Tax=Vitis vinifera TaxID=29760 RepID=A0A438DVS4_VITVI|nr:hypothetical protein CK203_115829 [Vitis vinifera]